MPRTSDPQGASPPAPSRRRAWLPVVALAGLTLVAFAPALVCGFVNYDDDGYVYDNPEVQRGLSARTISWAWTSLQQANWHPLTWLSLMLDTQLYGLDPPGYHLTNLLLHLANVLLFYLLLRRLTGAIWRSFFVAALFAVHPLRVESVAWVSERKDVLSTFFGLLALLAYVNYVRKPGVGRYSLIVLAMALSLLAKPMFVTLPFVLLLLDYWPLRRWQLEQPGIDGTHVPPSQRAMSLLLEKIPLLLLSAASGAVTVWAQSRGGAVLSLEQHPLAFRIANSLVSYAQYLRQTIWPMDLAVLYPFPRGGLPSWQVAAAVLLLLGMTGVSFAWRRRYQYLLVGWFFYLGTLVPVIGLVQVGEQARADRYTYVPMIGMFLLITWGAADLSSSARQSRLPSCLAGLVLIFLTVATWVQVSYWRSSLFLWEHALRVTEGSATAHNNLGGALLNEGDMVNARRHFEEALRLDSDHVPAYLNLGLLFQKQGDWTAASRAYQQALRRNPTSTTAHISLGVVLQMTGDYAEASRHFWEAVRIEPNNANAHNNLGVALLNLKEFPEAIHHFQEALRLGPPEVGICANLGLAFEYQEQWDDAARCFREALALQPQAPEHHRELAYSLYQRGRTEAARAEYAESLRLDPGWPATLSRTAWSLATNPDAKRRNGRRALRLARQIEQVTSRSVATLDTLAAAHAENGEFTEAAALARQALAAAGTQAGQAAQIQARLRLYESKRPFRGTGH